MWLLSLQQVLHKIKNMTLFNPEILSIEEDILYHEQQLKEAQERLDQVKVSQAYSDNVISSLEDFFENTDPFLYEVLKGHIEQMFEENKITYNKDLKAASLPSTVEEETNTALGVKRTDDTTSSQPQKEFGPLSYYELTGRPDVRPDTFEDLAPNITYSSSGRAYVGFHNREEAKEFRDSISEPSLLDDAVIMNGFKYEVKFHCSREYVQQFVQVEKSHFEKISPRVIYNHNDQIVYLGMTAKGRCDYYGQYLTGQLTVGEKYTYVDKPSFINSEEYKYELRITEVSIDDAIHLANFNLQRDPDHPDNAKLLTDWRANKVRELPPAYTPSPKPTPINELKVGEIVSRGTHNKQYKVLGTQELQGTLHAEVICIYNSEMPALVNQTSYLKEVYPVLKDDIQYSSDFEDKEKLDFPPGPYQEVPLASLELCDIVTTSSHVKTYYEVIENKGKYITAKCIHSATFPNRIGESYTLQKAFLVEKADSFVADEARLRRGEATQELASVATLQVDDAA